MPGNYYKNLGSRIGGSRRMTLSILDSEYNRGIDAAIEEVRRDILALQSMGAEFGKDQFDWVHDRIRNLEQLIPQLERRKV